MSDMTYSIAENFSETPGPRYRRQGPFSGELFRSKLLGILAKTDGRILIDLDGTRGFGSSFLDEAFGGLISSEGLSRSDVLGRFQFKSDSDPSYIVQIMESIDRARPKTAVAH